MPPSQLKRLKSSLREKGILGPQKPKKAKKREKRDGGSSDQQARRNAAIATIRQDLNPFDVKVLARPKKFEATTANGAKSELGKSAMGRPGISKSMGEETRRKTLLPEMNRRNKVGGILDRRFGENDPTMAPEDRMMERFVREQQRRKSHSQFDLEEASDDEEPILTHGGEALRYDTQQERDDFDNEGLALSSDEDGLQSRKRRRVSVDRFVDGDMEGSVDQSERPKTHKEIMQEVIAKSKLHKYERQKAKEEDDEQREELDQLLPEILGLVGGGKATPNLPPPPPPPAGGIVVNPDRAALINGTSVKDPDKQYDENLRQMAIDQRALPTERTKTEEEMAKEKADRLKKLEEKRLQRMRGEPDSGGEDEEELDDTAIAVGDDQDEALLDDAAAFGFTRKQLIQRPQGIDDEDEFLLDPDLVASGSDINTDDSDMGDGSSAEDESEDFADDDDDEFIRGILSENATNNVSAETTKTTKVNGPSSNLAFTYPCPRSHEELLQILEKVEVRDVPTVVQRIRALHDPRLAAENKLKLADFSCALVDHIYHISQERPAPPLSVVEMLIRHLHSLSLRHFKLEISEAFRKHLTRMQTRDFATSGDLTILTAIGTIYPTSDHFHQVVTPAITTIGRWLGLTTPRSNAELIYGAYLCQLCLDYQRLSKRYVPELVRFSVAALNSDEITPGLVFTYIQILISAMDLWAQKPSFTDVFSPGVLNTLKKHVPEHPQAIQKLRIHISQARLQTRTLELHHHRPLPIKTQIPKFEENFNPSKHYDPDRARADAKKLQNEYKKERKGALRELRKDANFIAREKLRQKKEADRAYEEKYRKLVASIQNEEGHAAKEYEREKRARKAKR